ncbi:pirin family protein [Kineothrix sp. MB12-C1]|uniref:pirin family protein n=1 Tax=Kineothrix sp. MB12-C1 TaxID=3070215 RepID=UPI0027D29192|nr:pirin family protein [Kineothrix sp. MB12-C1]WMC92072.1 pirin family protein [Kineothrix sp. MB12-C1]
MDNVRAVKKISKGMRATDGAGVRLVRVFGYHDTQDYDPFLMFDAFDSVDPEDYIKGFPWHPHRGIETITYLIEGEMEHGDSLGNRGVIKDGDCQWMTAGSGIIHQEMPKASKRMLGAQLWLNLPAKDKMTPPKYGDIKAESVPVIEEENSKIHVIAGEYLGTQGAFEGSYVKATYLDVEVKAGGRWHYDSEETSTLFIYIVEGEGRFSPDSEETITERQAVLFGEGRRFFVEAKTNIRFFLLSGSPLKEPIAWGGPIVMNTKEELDRAFAELEEGTFIKG